MSSRVLVVWLLEGNLLEHGVCKHVDARVAFDEFFEFLELRTECLRMLLDMVDLLP